MSRLLPTTALLLAAAVLFASPARGATPLFTEHFSGNEGNWSSSSGAAAFDNQGWEITSSCKSQSAIKLGTGNNEGSATSPEIPIPSGWTKASVTVSFQAAAWYGTKNCTTTLSVLENNLVTTNATWSVSPIAENKNDALNIADLSGFTADANGDDYELAFEVRGPFQLKFETSGSEKRLYLDTVVATGEEIVSVVPDLDPPGNLATNALSHTSFSVAWDAVNGATGYVVRVDGAVVAACAPEARSASVAGLAAGSTHVVTVVAQGDGTTNEDSQPAQISVELPAWPAAVEPDPVASGVSADAFAVSWTPRSGETYAVRAWTLGPVNRVEEDFADYPQTKTAPAGWTFDNESKFYITFPGFVQLGKAGASIVSPTFPAALASVSFWLKPNGASGASSVEVAGSPDGTVWTVLTNVAVSGSTGFTVELPLDEADGIRAVRWTYAKDSGNVGFGAFVATGEGIATGRTYLPGFGPEAAALGSTATCTFGNPVAGATHYVEVTATGAGGDTAQRTIEVEVPDEADPWRPVWTAPDAVAGFVGKAVSFAVSAALEGGAAQAVAFASGPDGAAFDPATGAFSWTPAAAAATNAVFRVVNDGGTYERAVAISVEPAVRTGTLFREDFSRFTTKWNGSSDLAAVPAPPPDNEGWIFDKASRAPSALRIGKDAKDESLAIGSALSPEIVLTNNLSSGTISLSFEAAAYFKQTTAMRVSVLDAETGAAVWTSPVRSLDPIDTVIGKDTAIQTVAEGVHLDAAFAVEGVPERFRLLFETVSGAADHRLYLDTIVVSQTWDASVPALPAPVPAVGEPGMDSLPVSWTAVAGATGYDLEARLASGGTVAARLAGVAGTSATVAGLADGTEYLVRVRALGDGAAAANSPWSEAVAATTVENPDRPEFAVSAGADAAVEAGTAKTFAVSATRGAAAVPVYFDGLSPDPAVAGSARFSGGAFSWTPTDGDAGTAFTATFRAGAYSTNVVFAVTARPPLAAPAVAVDSVGVKDAALSWNAQSRAVSYEVRLWTGTADYTKAGVCYEDFGAGVLPTGWSQWGTGAGWYPNSGYERYRVKFTETGDTLVSKCHSAPVTELSFHTRSSSTTATSTWTLFASHGGTNETDWVQLQKSTITTASDTPISRSFESSDGYRRFKWEFTKDSGTLGLGAISATHAGAGPKFVAGFGSVAEARNLGLVQTLALVKLRPERDYFLEVTAVGENGEKESAVVRFSTLPADKATVLILR